MPNDLQIATPPATPLTNAPDKEQFSREYVHELREENKNARLARKAAEDLAEKHLSDAQKAKDEAKTVTEAAKKSADERIIRAELKASAIKAGMVDLDGLKLADLTTVKLNDAGEVEGAEALMESLKKAKPYLFGDTKSTSKVGSELPKAGDAKLKLATEMSKEEYMAAKAKIRRGDLPQAA